mmetsp:Transcript_7147/g.12854  ORF Transcript_7147/g.12854 Transcript_7147/m.12854 type:complete len:257 (+) Transcript_7147:512-1282(+)
MSLDSMFEQMHLCLIRHGQTEANVARFVQGQSDSALTQLGMHQATQTGIYLAQRPIHFHSVYVSDLGRTQHTFNLIQQSYNASIHSIRSPLLPQLDPRLRERANGHYEGKPWGSSKHEAELCDSPRKFRPSGGGESWIDVQERVASFITELFDTHCGLNGKYCDAITNKDTKYVMIVSHGGLLRELVAFCEGKQNGPDHRTPVMNNGAVTLLHVKRDKFNNTFTSNSIQSNHHSHITPDPLQTTAKYQPNQFSGAE